MKNIQLNGRSFDLLDIGDLRYHSKKFELHENLGILPCSPPPGQPWKLEKNVPWSMIGASLRTVYLEDEDFLVYLRDVGQIAVAILMFPVAILGTGYLIDLSFEQNKKIPQVLTAYFSIQGVGRLKKIEQ